ncbi:MAG: DUF4293 family protein [Bacteroidota bacterium]|nr:DUF4293 family protein [Bacteroidota bacterium]MDP3145458.1 DUF4293 family protein [Bacteroidota bacterium]MDP3557238.1 DUF4293 family protein [Bacteroidota bacterium]
MIQRKQSLFLIQVIFLGLSLLFVPCQTIFTKAVATNVYIMPLTNFESTIGHLFAVVLNFIGLILAVLALFLFKKRTLQVKLCYSLITIWLVLIAMMLFCPFVIKTEEIIEIRINYFVVAIGLFSVLASYIAAHFIKKDIALLKSADRIR